MSTVFSFLLLYQLEVEFRFHSNVNSGEINKIASLVSYDMYRAIFCVVFCSFITYGRFFFEWWLKKGNLVRMTKPELCWMCSCVLWLVLDRIEDICKTRKE